MAGLVEEVAETDHARSFSDEVHGEAGRRAAEDANHWIEFLAAALQIGTRHREVSGIQRGRGGDPPPRSSCNGKETIRRQPRFRRDQ